MIAFPLLCVQLAAGAQGCHPPCTHAPRARRANATASCPESFKSARGSAPIVRHGGNAAPRWGRPGRDAPMRKTRLLRATVLAVACSLSMAVSAQSGVPKAIDIPPGDLVSNLQEIGRASRRERVGRYVEN